ncbi:MATE family efflux transporter [Peptacetobacter hominis]|uniref:Multidrug export protein MepA n=1 Tax=Peptacetobacter hominis TaxID=2743610 RepID=A0A544QYG7_9FIRM|nr:MATE family efflux transporter [Peptacetobacter hominis]TQQ85769.1 MATE family efflux transporter [Peptacetobacter hominis]
MDNKSSELGTEKVGKLLLKLAVPAIIAQLVNVLYNIVDRMFIGRMPGGELAMAGVGLAFPIITLISAFSSLIGMGGGPLAAIKMGEQDNESAEKIMGNSFISLIIIAVVLTVFFQITSEDILWMFGASDNTIGYAMDYMRIYLIGTIFVMIALGMNPFLNTQGFAKMGMITVVIGAALNIILDPVFIFGFNMGVKGAALATIISQCVSAIWVFLFLIGKKTILKLKIMNMKPSMKVILSITSLGVSPFIMQSTESLVLVSLNTKLQMYGGDIAVSAMTVMSSIMQMVTLPLIGIMQGAQPIISYNYGAKNIKRVKKAFILSLKTCLLFTLVTVSMCLIFPQMFVRIFSSNAELIEFTSWAMRIYFAGMAIFGIQIACQQTFLSLGKAKISLILAMLRKIILLVPLIFILPAIMDDKLFAVFLAEPIADILAVISTAICFSIFYRKNLLNKE